MRHRIGCLAVGASRVFGWQLYYVISSFGSYFTTSTFVLRAHQSKHFDDALRYEIGRGRIKILA